MTHDDSTPKKNEVTLSDLAQAMQAGFQQVNERFDDIDQRFEGIDQRFEGIDKRLQQLDAKIDFVHQNLLKKIDYLNHDLDATISNLVIVKKDHGQRIGRLEKEVGIAA